jgi:GT2 family glycosyltransferase
LLCFSKSTRKLFDLICRNRTRKAASANHSVFRTLDDSAYWRWIEEFDTMKSEEIAALQQKISDLPVNPNIAILPIAVVTPSPSELSVFRRRLDAQFYRNWRFFLSRNLDRDHRPIATVSTTLMSEAIAEAAETSDFVLPLPLDAVLRPHALAQFVLAIAEVPDADVLYADEDVLRNGKRSRPHFKTDWDPYLILGRNYIGTPALYRSEAIRRARAQELVSATVDNLLHAVALRVTGATSPEKILHIPSVLCHRTTALDWCGAEGRKIVSAHLAETGSDVEEISPAPDCPQWNRVGFRLPEPLPLASIIVPTRDRANLLGPCANSLLTLTNYPSFELIVVDNGTVEPEALSILESLRGDPRVRILRDDRPFNYSRLNNSAAREARGDVLILLNNDTEIIHADWLTELVSLASHPDIGVVGAKLLYSDWRVQHAGMSFGPDKSLMHQMRLANRHETGPEGALVLLRSVSAVTGACLALRRSLYLEVGGLNETTFKVAYNDIDLCRRIARKGLSIVWTPFAEVLHYESASRGSPITSEAADRETSELIAFWSMNPEFYEDPDPFHNPQIEFKVDCVDFARPPRPHRFRHSPLEKRLSAFLY